MATKVSAVCDGVGNIIVCRPIWQLGHRRRWAAMLPAANAERSNRSDHLKSIRRKKVHTIATALHCSQLYVCCILTHVLLLCI